MMTQLTRTRQAAESLTKGRLLERRTRQLARFQRAVECGSTREMARAHRELQHVAECLGIVERSLAPAPAPRFVVSSLFLTQCFRDLTADANEQFFFITGSEVDGVAVLDQKVEFPHERRTPLMVRGDMGATHKLLIRLEQFGHRLLAHFHSHPGRGLSATTPSGKDDAFQKRLEGAGYPTIAAIFSRDGYIRFFRLSGEFDLEVHGEGVESVGRHEYRITNVDASR
jgi:hypothetical protein